MNSSAWACLLACASLAACQPARQPSHEARVRMGEALFHDRALSLDEDRSCADCHHPEQGFSGVSSSVDVAKAPSLLDVREQRTLGRGNPIVMSLELHAVIPIFGEQPVELGMNGRERELIERVSRNPGYRALARRGWPEQDGVRVSMITEALGAFQETIVSSRRSRFDRWLTGEQTLTRQEEEGAALFFGSAGCVQCHAGRAFTDSSDRRSPPRHRSIGAPDPTARLLSGVFAHTGREEDLGMIKTPGLRGVTRHQVFFMDASESALDAAIHRHAPELSGDQVTRLCAFLGTLEEPE